MKYLKAIKEYIVDEIIHPVEIFFRVHYERLSRSIAFAIFVWDQVDFDSYSIFALVAFKLKRVKKCMDEGYGVYPKETMDAMREAIAICNRLYEHKYEEPYSKAHDKKWGRLRVDRMFGKDGLINWNPKRKYVKTKADERKESKEHRKCYEMAHLDKLDDLDRLNELLKRYQNEWWD